MNDYCDVFLFQLEICKFWSYWIGVFQPWTPFGNTLSRRFEKYKSLCDRVSRNEKTYRNWKEVKAWVKVVLLDAVWIPKTWMRVNLMCISIRITTRWCWTNIISVLQIILGHFSTVWFFFSINQLLQSVMGWQSKRISGERYKIRKSLAEHSKIPMSYLTTQNLTVKYVVTGCTFGFLCWTCSDHIS